MRRALFIIGGALAGALTLTGFLSFGAAAIIIFERTPEILGMVLVIAAVIGAYLGHEEWERRPWLHPRGRK